MPRKTLNLGCIGVCQGYVLGVEFEVPQSPQTETQEAIVKLHLRSCRRALDKVKVMSTDAVHPAHIQGYLSRWAAWWQTVVRLKKQSYLVSGLAMHLS
jgi:hypothetical protein